MILKKQVVINTINVILFVLLIVMSFYITYKTSKYYEKFDSETVTKINGVSLRNVKSSPSNATIKIVNASDNKSNETNASYSSSPSVAQVSSPAIISSPSAQPVKPTIPPISSDLSTKEKQLFDAFLEKRITDEKIQELIESGILTEQLVEKFLSMIDDLPEGPPLSHAPKTLNKTTPAAQNNANLLEGFCGNNYARANSF